MLIGKLTANLRPAMSKSVQCCCTLDRFTPYPFPFRIEVYCEYNKQKGENGMSSTIGSGLYFGEKDEKKILS